MCLKVKGGIYAVEIFSGRQYYLTALFIIAIAMLLFLWSFEKKKPQTREVVVIAVMTALAVLGRVMFFMTPQIKPCIAVIIIAGIMLGKQAGFLCGALTGFVSDFFFGQGPWTPWQMFAFGLVGLLASVAYTKKVRNQNYHKWALCLFGFVATFVIYGGVMDSATVFMYTDKPEIKVFLATYVSGIVFNAIHGGSTAIFLWLLAEPFFKKLGRMKIKYSMYKEG